MMIRAQFSSRVDRMRKYVTEKRATIEQSRSIRVKRIQSDVERICKREWEYAKHMAEEVLPFKLTWNDDAMKKFKDMMPFTVEVKEEVVADDDIAGAAAVSLSGTTTASVAEVMDANAPPS